MKLTIEQNQSSVTSIKKSDSEPQPPEGYQFLTDNSGQKITRNNGELIVVPN